jgi:hypothetical protein
MGSPDVSTRLETRARSTVELIRAFVGAARIEGFTVIDRWRIRAEGRRVEHRASGGLATSEQWLKDTHHLLGAVWPCLPCERFGEDVWPGIRDRTRAPMSGRDSHDGDSQLAQAAWSVTRHLQPDAVIETGVARGITSAAVLSALNDNEQGHLYSIDLPPLSNGWMEQSGVAIDPTLRARWTYIRGSSRRRLPRLIADLEQIDLFVHDSLHTVETMGFEFDCAWGALRTGGVMLSDDIDDSRAFEIFMADHPDLGMVIGVEPSKSGGRFGIVRKTSK